MKIQEIVHTANEEVKIQSRGLFEFLAHSDINFEGKKPEENILVFTRRHWFVLLNTILGGMLASLLPLILIILSAQYLIRYNLSALFTLGWVIYLMIIWFYMFHRLTMHSLDTWIVTNERVIDISQIGLFRRKVSELHLNSIEDISVHTDGLIQSYLNFGDVEIQTAASTQRFLFEQIHHPLIVKDKIMSAVSDFNHSNHFHK